jgi:type VI secretion system protein ImpG
MEPRLLELYNSELRHVRGMGEEFAREFPKIAGRLGLSRFECADPYVERLLEGFAFLAARVQLKLEAEFPRFTQHLLDVVYPHFLSTMPAMMIAQFQPDAREGSLANGFTIPRSTALLSHPTGANQTLCEFRTAHPVELFPVELSHAEYFLRSHRNHTLPAVPAAKSGFRFVVRATPVAPLSRTRLDKLVLFLRGDSALSSRLYEQILGHAVAVIARPLVPQSPAQELPREPRFDRSWDATPDPTQSLKHDAGPDQTTSRELILDRSAVRSVGFREDEALLPVNQRSFQGYRLLQEYLAFPQRFHFIEINGLQPAVARCQAPELEVFVLLDAAYTGQERLVQRDDFALHCTPAINLFPKRADRIHLTDRHSDFHVIPDRTRPLDFEVHSVTRVVGHGLHGSDEQEFLPFYGQHSGQLLSQQGAYFATERRARMTSEATSRRDAAATGCELFLSLVDAAESPYRSDLRMLSVQTLCTNRLLTADMPLGFSQTDFTLQMAAPIHAVRCLAGPTLPATSPAMQRAELGWKLIHLLSLNYLSLTDSNAEDGATALREMLSLHCHRTDPALQKQIDGVRHVDVQPVTRRLPMSGPIAFGRGLQITLRCDESCFEGSGVFLLGSVLEQFFARYASINSFTELVLQTAQRNEVYRWPLRTGRRQTL